MREVPFVNEGEEEEEEEDEDEAGDEEGPPSIDPYAVLGLEAEATADDVKKAYRKLALKHHPGTHFPWICDYRNAKFRADKAPESDKDAANKAFQEIAFAYAVLSDDRRRKRYDLTGSTAETLEDDADFDWLSFYREQFENVVNEEAINKLSNEYKGSADERKDLLNAYIKGKGSLGTVYQLVMLSDILEDDERFRNIIDEEIAATNIKPFPAYTRETDATRQKAKDAEIKRREAYDDHEGNKEREETAKGKSKAKAKKGGAGDMADLAALIQSRQKARSGDFFGALEAKYAPKPRGSKRSTPMEEPPEEMFEANRTAKRPKRSTRAKKIVAEDDEDEMDVGEEDVGESEEEVVKPKKRGKAKPKAKGRAKAWKGCASTSGEFAQVSG
jgi:DnaJ family protein C protein 9